MAIKIKFKRSEIVANILLNLAGLGICCIIILNSNFSMPVKNLIVKIIVLAGMAALTVNLWRYLRRYIKVSAISLPWKSIISESAVTSLNVHL